MKTIMKQQVKDLILGLYDRGEKVEVGRFSATLCRNKTQYDSPVWQGSFSSQQEAEEALGTEVSRDYPRRAAPWDLIEERMAVIDDVRMGLWRYGWDHIGKLKIGALFGGSYHSCNWGHGEKTVDRFVSELTLLLAECDSRAAEFKAVHEAASKYESRFVVWVRKVGHKPFLDYPVENHLPGHWRASYLTAPGDWRRDSDGSVTVFRKPKDASVVLREVESHSNRRAEVLPGEHCTALERLRAEKGLESCARAKELSLALLDELAAF